MNLIQSPVRAFSKRTKIRYLVSIPLLFALSILASCTMINEDLAPCAPMPNAFVKVNYVYDYNMHRTDLVNDHVGTVYLYVFSKNENGDTVFRFQRAKSRVSMNDGNNVDFSMLFDTVSLPPGDTYYMVAMAQGNHVGYENSLLTPGFQLMERMVPDSSLITDFRIKLDRNDDGEADFGEFEYKDAYGNNNLMLDTVWSTKPDEVQELRLPTITYTPQPEPIPDFKQEVTIPLMRITNYIRVNLVADGFSPKTSTDAYNIYIDFPNGNGTIDYTGTTYPVQPLRYHSLRKEIEEYQPKNNGAQYNPGGTRASDGKTYALAGDFGVSRMQITDNSSLKVVEAKTGKIIAQIGGDDDDSFAKWLADYFKNGGCSDGQEFLDREYNWTIDIKLKDGVIPEEPGDDPGDNPGGDDPGDNPGGDDPGDNPGGDDPGDNPGGDDPGDKPGGDDPGDNPGGDDPGDKPGGDDPGDKPGGDDPGDNPGGDDPGDKPGGDDPGENPGLDNVEWFQIGCNVLGWGKRMHFYDL